MRRGWSLLAAMLLAACSGDATTSRDATTSGSGATVADDGLIAVTITSANGPHVFRVEIAATPQAQTRGLMFRTDIPADGGMLFAPYPADGGPPVDANFWMKDTPSSLDIVYIRADRTIARIAENTVPFSEAPIPSGEPVAAVLEIRGGRANDLGIAEGDGVAWTK